MRRDGPPRVVALFVPDLQLRRVVRPREVAEVLPSSNRALAALRGLAEAMFCISPVVELSPPDSMLLDASAAYLLTPMVARRAPGQPDEAAPERAGVRGAQLHRAPRVDAEQILARRALAIAAAMGYSVRAAVGDGRGPTRALARCSRVPIVWIAPDDMAGSLAPLPVAALGLSPYVTDRLAELGVDSAGALARLPQGTLAHRFGPEGVLAAMIARGEDVTPLVPYVPETLPEEIVDLEEPMESAGPLVFILKRLAEHVAARLAGRGLGASRLRVVLKLDPRGEERLLVSLAAPSAVAARWLLPLKESLFALRLAGPVVGLGLSAVEVSRVAPDQLAFDDRPEALEALEGVLARLSARLGNGAFFSAEPVDRHRPEGAYRSVSFRGRRKPSSRSRSRSESSALTSPGIAERPTRLLPSPEHVVAEGDGGRITALRVGGRARALLAMAGPERLRGEWWAEPFDRDYYRVRLDGLGDCWVYRDGADGLLYLHGFFD